jgi:hypothetical protein
LGSTAGARTQRTKAYSRKDVEEIVLQSGRPPESLTALGVDGGNAFAQLVALTFALAVSSTVLRNLECLMERTFTLE